VLLFFAPDRRLDILFGWLDDLTLWTFAAAFTAKPRVTLAIVPAAPPSVRAKVFTKDASRDRVFIVLLEVCHQGAPSAISRLRWQHSRFHFLD
jgi:hypothetical protein